MKCVHIIKCAKVRALFGENKVLFARAEQLWLISIWIRDPPPTALWEPEERGFSQDDVLSGSGVTYSDKYCRLCFRSSTFDDSPTGRLARNPPHFHDVSSSMTDDAAVCPSFWRHTPIMVMIPRRWSAVTPRVAAVSHPLLELPRQGTDPGVSRPRLPSLLPQLKRKSRANGVSLRWWFWA